MKNILLLIILALMICSCTQRQKGWPSDVKPPVAEKIEKKLVLHGDTRLDFYYWMNDPANPDVISYLLAENEYRDKMMAHTNDLQDELYNEMVGRIKQDDESAPVYSNGYYYYARYEKGGEYPIYCRKKGSLDAEEEVILNVPKLAEGHSYFRVGSYDISFNNEKIAYTVDTLGRRQYTIYVKNLSSGKVRETGISYAGGDVTWSADNKTFFYTAIDPVTLRYHKIYRFNIFESDYPEEVYYEKDETYYYMGVSRTKDDEYLVVNTRTTLSNESLILKSDNPLGKFEVFQPREKDLEYRIEHINGKFLVITNYNAPNYRLMQVDAEQTGRDYWKEVIPHRDDVLLESMEVFNDYLVLQERSNAMRNLRIINHKTNKDYYLQFEEEAYTVAINSNFEIDSDIFRYSYTSLTTPNTIYDYNMATGETNLVKQTEVLGDFDSNDYTTKRLFVEARDGRKVPLSLVYRKGMKQDGKNPLLLYGYGSYGARLDPRFNSNRISLLDRGFIVVLAHVRGGQEMGRYWYEEGRLLNKKNTFYDFIDCAHFLIDEKYTNPDKLFAYGISAGGLLIGAVVNMAPELFKGVIAGVPFVDVVTTMLDETIPLTTAEYGEWGNPNIKEHYEYMLAYSPYDNISKQDYPNILATSGLHDSQVQYFEPTKWVAKLRDYNTADTKIILTTNMEAGHSGASGRFARLKEVAFEFAFMITLLEQ